MNTHDEYLNRILHKKEDHIVTDLSKRLLIATNALREITKHGDGLATKTANEALYRLGERERRKDEKKA